MKINALHHYIQIVFFDTRNLPALNSSKKYYLMQEKYYLHLKQISHYIINLYD